uniref:mRNA cap-binding protein n=1 Tax=Glycine max TaxID=3847 RepID=I1JD62_SOYBN
MDFTVEKKESENNAENAHPTTLDSSSQLASALDSNNKEIEERQARELKAGLHPLKKIVEFSTVEGFWVCYCHLARPASLPSPTDLHLFKEGIRPLWEDSANCNGGKWIIRFKKVVSGRFWEDLVLALVGDQLDYGDNICGAVLSIRFNEDILSVWNRNASDHQAVMALRDSIKRHLKLPHSYVMEYKPHDASLRDNSSYRNTWLRG